MACRSKPVKRWALNPHFSPGRWNHDEKLFVVSRFIELILGNCRCKVRWARSGLSFSPQRVHARSTVVTATLFALEHALREKFLRHCHAPR